MVVALCLFLAVGTYGAAVTFVCGEKEKGAIDHYALLCNMCITPLPRKLLELTICSI